MLEAVFAPIRYFFLGAASTERRAVVYFAEFEVPDLAPRRAQVYFAELQVPDVGGGTITGNRSHHGKRFRR